MLFQKTNLLEKLHLEREKQRKSGENVLKEVQRIFADLDKNYSRIDRNLSELDTLKVNSFDFDSLDAERIFHINQIKKVCIDYRLRFLDSKYFKGEIPSEAYSKIRELEKTHTTELKGFKIIAPSRLFKLEDKDDPLLFAPMGNGYFYLVHKWGNDLHPLRKLMMWPFKNVGNLIFVIILLSYVTTLLIPNGLFSKSNSVAEFGILFFFIFKSIVAVAIFYGFALGKNFSPAIWNSKYYNA